MYRCPQCDGLFEVEEDFFLTYLEDSGLIPLREPDLRPARAMGDGVTLGEGWTPLVPVKVGTRDVYFKCEHLNPTGSFKDRGTAVLVSVLLQQGVEEMVEDSSGNAGASLAAYAAAAGIQARIFMPAYASGPKRMQIEAYGADVVLVEGPRSKSAEAVLEAVSAGAVYASHAYLPCGQPGISRIAPELLTQLGVPPGAVIAPAGHGSLLLSLWKGFDAARRAGALNASPPLIGVQAAACAPLHARFHHGVQAQERVLEQETAAEGVRILNPYRAEAVVDCVRRSDGTILAVDEPEIEAGYCALRARGFFVEKTSAVVWPALEQLLPDLADPVVVILTGHGLKQPAL